MTAERHAVADLLTDEMRERVRRADFRRNDDLDSGWRARVVAKVGRQWCCPFGVALTDRPKASYDRFPDSELAAAFLGERGQTDEAKIAIRDFMEMVDSGQVGPADIKTMLGCDS